MRRRSFVIDDDLWNRLIKTVKKQSKNTGETISASSIIRVAIIKYLKEVQNV